MPKKPSQQLVLDESLYAQPDADSLSRPAAKPLAKPRRKAQASPGASQQPFLPGLSRRGRPRAKNPMPPAQRATQSRQRRAEAGAKRIEFMLEAQVADALAALVAHYKVPRTEVIARLILKAARRLPPQN